MSDEKSGGGTPAWVMTFADLMSLLLCFFVLLLSFAEMDIIKYKQVAGSMKMAFGVQKDVESSKSDQSEEFLEGRSTESPMFEETGKPDVTIPDMKDIPVSPDMEDILTAMKAAEEAIRAEELQAELDKLSIALMEDIEKGMVKVEKNGNDIIINISEKASFGSGTSTIRTSFIPALAKLQAALADVEGSIIVAGHTDDRPIRTAKFRSNWDLSASRAVSVVHELIKDGILPADRLLVEGHGDAHPIVPNDSPENRAKNRRVELTIVRPTESQELNSAADEIEPEPEAP
ncbi:MAG: OmpA family protein [Porticoccaceae bacterium]|nr:OmpA family protein [Porticoccaceae bacterium]